MSPSSAWKALEAAHASLLRAGVLVHNPSDVLALRRQDLSPAVPDHPPSTLRGRRRCAWLPARCDYVLAVDRPTGERALVDATARACGVFPNVATGYLADPQTAELFTQAVAAAVLGSFAEPNETLGKQIAGIVRKQRLESTFGRIDDSGRRFLPAPGELPALRGRVLDRLAASAAARQRYLDGIPNATLRVRELEAHYRRPGRPKWVATGLADMHLDRALGLMPELPRRREL
jgi:hypothetical protein